MKLKALFDDDGAVSPVIGVILMVAITVILAAVIGTFVLGLGQDIQNTSPTASVSATTGNNDIVLSHNSGDSLEASNVKIVVRDASNNAVEGTWNNGEWTSGSISTPQVNGNTAFTDSTEFTVGDSITISDASSNPGSGTYTVEIVHKPSSSTVSSSEVTVS